MANPQSANNGNRSNTGLYNTLWRWHFYAGLFCIPFVLTLAISGAIYLFKPQIDAFIDRPYHNLEVTGIRQSADEQIQAALESLPGSVFSTYQLPETDRQAAVVNVFYQGEPWLAYVNPYSLDILKTLPMESQFIRQVRTFHGELLAGNAGSILVELAGCWAIVLVITGLYLWWPRNTKGLAGLLYPRLRAKGRQLWRDIHAVTGIWLSFFTLFLLITGLPWALVWGSAFKELRQLGEPAEVRQDWSQGRSHEHHGAAPMGNVVVTLPQSVITTARALNLAPPVFLSTSEHGVWRAASEAQNRPQRAEAWIDGDTGEVLRSANFADKKLVDRVIGIGVAAHEGQLFGWFNQLLGLLTALGLVTLTVSGFILWRKRKPAGFLGAPPPIPNATAGKVVGTIILALAIVLPVMGMSLVVILLVEKLVIRRLPGTRVWLGLS